MLIQSSCRWLSFSHFCLQSGRANTVCMHVYVNGLILQLPAWLDTGTVQLFGTVQFSTQGHTHTCSTAAQSATQLTTAELTRNNVQFCVLQTRWLHLATHRKRVQSVCISSKGSSTQFIHTQNVYVIRGHGTKFVAWEPPGSLFGLLPV